MTTTKRGGARPGAGRPKGAINKASQAIRAAAATSGMLPHEFLLAITRGETVDGYTPTFAERMDAARAAAPFYAPKLAATEHTGADGGPIQLVTKEQRDAAVAAWMRADA